MNTIEIGVLVDPTKAEAGFDRVAESAERAGRQFAVTSDSTDALASKSSLATGALGALSSGFELVGLEKYATGLQSAAMATDFMSGVGDTLTLVMESAAIKTKVMTVAQKALNLAMRANPLGLLVTAGIVVVGLLTTLYFKSETFRNIVDAVGRKGREAFGWVVDKAQDLAGWFTKNLPDAIGSLKDKVVSVANTITAPFQKLWDLVTKVVDKVKSFDFPDLNPFGRATVTGPGLLSTVPLGRSSAPTTVTLTAAMLDRLWRGQQVSLDLAAYTNAGG